jgi:hypothetical protein
MKDETVEITPRREYFPPRIVHTEKLETRAVACMKADDSCASNGTGPINS